jgi:hypothetical protein
MDLTPFSNSVLHITKQEDLCKCALRVVCSVCLEVISKGYLTTPQGLPQISNLAE